MAIYTIPVAYSIWFIGIFAKYTKVKYYIAKSWCRPWMWAARAKLELVKTDDNRSYHISSKNETWFYGKKEKINRFFKEKFGKRK